MNILISFYNKTIFSFLFILSSPTKTETKWKEKNQFSLLLLSINWVHPKPILTLILSFHLFILSFGKCIISTMKDHNLEVELVRFIYFVSLSSISFGLADAISNSLVYLFIVYKNCGCKSKYTFTFFVLFSGLIIIIFFKCY